MSNACVKFPSIDQYRQVIRNVKNKASFAGLDENGAPIYQHVVFPTLLFLGTVKLHGTNASIRQTAKGAELIYQSRERVITPLDDNAGFATAMHRMNAKLIAYMDNIRIAFCIANDIMLTVYGEWCGGNIQKGVAISGLDKMFVVFAVRENVEEATKWYRANDLRFGAVRSETISEDVKIYSIAKFESFEVEVDFNTPEIAQNKFVELTLQVENKCPVGNYFGVSGVGEGLVWNCVTPGWEDGGFVFKTKGEKHSVSKVKTVAAVDIEKVNKMRDLVDLIMTVNRMEQMITVMKDREGLDGSSKNMGSFIKTCMADALKEETDTIIQNGFEPKEFAKAATTVIRTWYLSRTV